MGTAILACWSPATWGSPPAASIQGIQHHALQARCQMCHPAQGEHPLLGSKDFSTAPVLTERDLVNFPARVRPIEKAPTRLVIFPQEWFDALYPKTGVTGPYMALVGISTFLMSKEYFVIEHDFFAGVALAICITGIIKTAGVDWTASINKSLDEEEAALRSIRQSEIDAYNAMIANEEKAQADAAAWEDIIAIKKAVGLQLEGE